MPVSEQDLLDAARQGAMPWCFAEVVAIIDRHYHFTPTAFRNGQQDNPPGTNSGSCRVLAFARRHQLNEQETLGLFAEHFQNVQADPQGDSHPNIRQFLQYGWAGVQFSAEPLSPK